MLAARYVDGALGNRFVIPHLADEEGVAPEIMQTSVVVNRKPVYVLFSDTRTPEAEVAAFNAALARIRRDGTYDKILSRYIFGGES
jgi:ABC-type amino acid transport substrate-binding protein